MLIFDFDSGEVVAKLFANDVTAGHFRESCLGLVHDSAVIAFSLSVSDSCGLGVLHVRVLFGMSVLSLVVRGIVFRVLVDVGLVELASLKGVSVESRLAEGVNRFPWLFRRGIFIVIGLGVSAEEPVVIFFMVAGGS